MFFLKDLPTDKALQKIAKRYRNLQPSALMACAMLLRIGSDLLTEFESFLAAYGLSQGRFLTMFILNRTPDEGITPSAIAEKLGVTRATMTGLLDGLEKEGLVIRRGHPEDRRKLSVWLTRKGRQKLDNILPGYYKTIMSIMSDLTEKERSNLISLLEKVNLGQSIDRG